MAGDIPLPYKVPETATCPFTGQQLKLIHSESIQAWRAVGEFYFTKWYEDPFGLQSLMHDLHTKGGRRPKFPLRPKIEIKEIVRPEADTVLADVVERDKHVQDYLQQELEKK